VDQYLLGSFQTSDVEEFNLNKDKKEVSLLESARREELDKDEAKRKARKAARENNGPLLEDPEVLADAGEPVEVSIDEGNDDAVDEEQEDDRPDLLLRESARIVGDMIELGNDELALARQFSLLSKDSVSDSIN
jgi:hypothetical protein